LLAGAASGRDKIAAGSRYQERNQLKEGRKENEKEDPFRCNRIGNGAAEPGAGFLRNDAFVDG
jgi:hypothetical protein